MLIAKLNAESSTLPILHKQLDEIEKGIDNLVNAIQAGILTASTKQRLEQLEAEKSEISVQILKEEIAKPTVTKDDILAYLIKYRKLNMKQLDHRRRLIDSFVNAIYLFDDYLVITFNYKEGTKTITFAEIEEAFGSDLSSLTAPYENNPNMLLFGESFGLFVLFEYPNFNSKNEDSLGKEIPCRGFLNYATLAAPAFFFAFSPLLQLFLFLFLLTPLLKLRHFVLVSLPCILTRKNKNYIIQL